MTADVAAGHRVVRQVEAGAGEPAVVLEAGLNNGAAAWQRVMPLLAPHVRVVAYDRAGIGGSAPASGLVTIDRQLDDLASVITGLAAGPCVLAGHSWGGVLVQLLAFRRPDLVAGLVLVDPGHEEMERALPRPVLWGWRIVHAVFPDELHGDAPVTLAAMRELHAAARPFPDVPVVVLSAARGFPRRFRAHWTRLQAGLAAAAPRGRHVVVDETGHNIPRNRPDVVADMILAVAAQARASGGLRPGQHVGVALGGEVRRASAGPAYGSPAARLAGAWPDVADATGRLVCGAAGGGVLAGTVVVPAPYIHVPVP